MKVAIVIVNYNGAKFQNECIESILQMTYKNIEIIIVDNASTDNSIKLAKEKFQDKLIIIENGQNLGVAAGNNVGIKYALEHGAEYVLLLNNDTVLDKDMLTNLMQVADEKTIVVPKIYYYEPNNLIWYAGGNINWKLATVNHIGIKEKDSRDFDKESFVDYSPTCCMLINKQVFKNIGFMDEKYFMYCDDTDFCVRCIRNNFKIKYYPKAKLWHKVSSSTGGEESPLYVYYSNRNRLYFIDKFYEKKIIYKSIFYISRIKSLSKYLFKGEKLKFISMIKGLKDYSYGRLGIKM